MTAENGPNEPTSNDGWPSQTAKLENTNTSRSIFPTSKVPDDLPEGAIGLPEVIFEDLIGEEDIKNAVEQALAARKPHERS